VLLNRSAPVCVLVDHAPGDTFLGLPFRRRYDTAFPLNFKPRDAQTHGQGLGVTHVCLRVPAGYGVTFPGRKMAEQFSPQSPEEVAFKGTSPDPVTSNESEPILELLRRSVNCVK
jgi:hypothetical protein